MHTDEVNTSAEFHAYDAWIALHPEATLWQSTAWKRYQEALGRRVRIFTVLDETPRQGRDVSTILASALVVIDTTTGGLTTWDIPRGPLSAGRSGKPLEKLFELLYARATKDKCMAIYYSPAMELPDIDVKAKASARHEMPEATRIIDLTRSENEILTQMKPKGRYNITVARKHGVTVEQSTDIDAFHALAAETAARDGFSAPAKKQYEAFLHALRGSFLLLAYAHDEQFPYPPTPSPKGGRGSDREFPSPSGGGARGGGKSKGNPIAGLLGVTWGNTGIYYYGASSYTHRALMAPSLLQWEAMRHCKALGCERYDLFGIAPAGIRNQGPVRPGHPGGSGIRNMHPWEGVSAFKEKFGGSVAPYPAEQMMVLRPLPYHALRWKRRIFG